MRRTIILASLLMTAQTVTGHAQMPAQGTRVRVVAPALWSGSAVGTVAAVNDRVLVLAPEGGGTELRIPIVTVDRIEISGGRRPTWSSVLTHAGIGLVFGAVSGALVGPLITSSDCMAPKKMPDGVGGCLVDLSDGDARLRSAIQFGVAGTVIGAIVGAIVGSERWERLPTDRVRLIAHRRTGLGLAATVRF